MAIKKKSTNNLAYISYFLFLISPFISFPFILIDIYNRRKGAYFLFSMFMGVLSFLLLPHISLDVSRYYENYDLIASLNFSQFIDYLSITSDYVFYSLFFFFSRFNIKFQWVLFFLSTFNYYVVFWVYQNILSIHKSTISNRDAFKLFVLLFLSLGLLYYLSATRFTLATSFFILFLYFSFYQRSYKKGIVCFFVSVITHVGIVVYLPILLLMTILSEVKKETLLKFIFIGILVFSALPVAVLLTPIAPFSPSLVNKINTYIMFEKKDGNWVSALTHIILLLTSLYMLFNFNRFFNKTVFNMILLCIVAVVITLPFGHVVYDRYVLILKPIIGFGIVYLFFFSSKFNKKQKIKFYFIRQIAFLSFVLYTVFALYFYRESIRPYFDINNWFFITLMDLQYSYRDFLK